MDSNSPISDIGLTVLGCNVILSISKNTSSGPP